jgi:hypothetical protein
MRQKEKRSQKCRKRDEPEEGSCWETEGTATPPSTSYYGKFYVLMSLLYHRLTSVQQRNIYNSYFKFWTSNDLPNTMRRLASKDL